MRRGGRCAHALPLSLVALTVAPVASAAGFDATAQ